MAILGGFAFASFGMNRIFPHRRNPCVIRVVGASKVHPQMAVFAIVMLAGERKEVLLQDLHVNMPIDNKAGFDE